MRSIVLAGAALLALAAPVHAQPLILHCAQMPSTQERTTMREMGEFVPVGSYWIDEAAGVVKRYRPGTASKPGVFFADTPITDVTVTAWRFAFKEGGIDYRVDRYSGLMVMRREGKPPIWLDCNAKRRF